MFIGLLQRLEQVLGLHETLKLEHTDKSFFQGNLGVHLDECKILLAFLLLCRLYVYIGDIDTSFSNVLLDSAPGLCNLIISMMFWQIKFVVFKTNLLLCLKKHMQVFRGILVLLLGDNILNYSELLLEVL